MTAQLYGADDLTHLEGLDAVRAVLPMHPLCVS